MVKAVQKCEALIEVTLRLWRIRCDFARIGTEAFEERFRRAKIHSD